MRSTIFLFSQEDEYKPKRRRRYKSDGNSDNEDYENDNYTNDQDNEDHDHDNYESDNDSVESGCSQNSQRSNDDCAVADEDRTQGINIKELESSSLSSESDSDSKEDLV